MPWDPTALPQETSTEPIGGWRAWRIVRLADGGLRLAPTTPRPHWEPGRAPAATCSGSHTRLYFVLDQTAEPHRSPDKYCTCGYHATKDPARLVRPGGPAGAIGLVSMWGRVIEHANGWRAEHIYPARFRLTCPWCVRIGAWPAEPATVAMAGDDVVPLCAEHRHRTRRVRSWSTPEEVQALLLDSYGVEVLPIELLPPADRKPLTSLVRTIDRRRNDRLGRRSR
jgi:hypothetical protein